MISGAQHRQRLDTLRSIQKLEAARNRGMSYVQASQDLSVHPSQLRDWVKKFADDPQHAFPGHGQMKPEQLESRGSSAKLPS